MRLLLFIAYFLFSNTTFAQNFITLSGKVTDKQNGAAISYATLSIKNHAIGTVTNTEGGFVFHVPEKYRNDSLAVSSIGYKTYTIKISDIKDKFLNIRLEQKVYDLSEVKVKPKNALEIVKQAIAKIPENYPTQPINMEGFYREMTFENDTCVEMAEAACEFYYRPYGEEFRSKDAYENYYKYTDSHFDYFINNILSLPTNPNDQSKVIEGRSSNLFHKNHFIVVPRGGPLALTSYDLVKTKYIFLKPELLKKYKFNLKDITSYQNNQVYIIDYQSKKKNPYISGLIYIDINSLAFIRISINSSNIGKQIFRQYWTSALYRKKRKKCKDLLNNYNQQVVVNYKNINNKWYLNNVQFIEDFDYIFSKYYINKKTEPKFSYKMDRKLLINKHITENIKKFSDKDNFSNSFYSILYEEDLNYNPVFWKNYNLVKTTPLQDSIMQQLELYQSLDEQYSEQFIKNDTLKALVAKIQPCINPATRLADNYYWMQDIKNPEVLKYVEAENKYTQNGMLPLKKIKRNLYNEMINRIVKDTVQNRIIMSTTEYVYFYKKPINNLFENIYRRNISSGKEELVLNINKLSEGNNNYSIDNIYPSPDNKLIAYIESYGLGYENTLKIKDLSTGEITDEIENVETLFWKNNEKAFYYLTWDKTNRVNSLMYHKINTNRKNDLTVYYESNKQKNLMVFVNEKRWLLIFSEDDFKWNNVFLIDLNDAKTELKKIVSAQKKHTDYIQIFNDTLWSLSHENGIAKIYYAPMKNPEKKNWQVLLKDENDNIRQISVLQNYIILKECDKMIFKLKIYNKKGLFVKEINFKEIPNKITLVYNEQIQDKNKFRFSYTSLVTPKIIYEYDIISGKQKIIKQEKFKNYNKENYKTKLLWVKSKDGVKVPVSLVYNKKLVKINGKSPLYLYAYGCYGVATFPEFTPEILSLLDRGVIYAVAHVRGGSELGEKWHEAAMQLKKKNSFNDFIAAAEYLIANKYTSKGKIVAEGGSAGGLVVGAVANMRPDLFNSVILISPMLDVLNSLTDTLAAFNTLNAEFGNPKVPEIYNYIKSYSPYQNIKAQDYPNMLFYIGLNDNRVEYWQSLKTVARLRALKTDNNKLYLKTELYAGHTSYKGTEAYYMFSAFIYAFIFDNLGIKH